MYLFVHQLLPNSLTNSLMFFLFSLYHPKKVYQIYFVQQYVNVCIIALYQPQEYKRKNMCHGCANIFYFYSFYIKSVFVKKYFLYQNVFKFVCLIFSIFSCFVSFVCNFSPCLWSIVRC